MRLPLAHAHLCAIIVIAQASRLAAWAEESVQPGVAASPRTPLPPPPTSPPRGEQKMLASRQDDMSPTIHTQGGEDRQTFSCYACSTLDYDSPLNNPCRNLELASKRTRDNEMRDKHTHIVGPGHLQFSHSKTTTTVSSIETTTEYAHQQQHSPTAEALVMDASPGDHDSYGATSTQAAPRRAPSPYETTASAPLPADLTGTGYGELERKPNKVIDGIDETRPNAKLLLAHPRPQPLGQGVGVSRRACNEGENFCSIVSVARIEFVHETVYSKFWALERNCSRSCNTGCMMIGERVRLRVCSQCCKTKDCNMGSGGAHSSLRLVTITSASTQLAILGCIVLHLLLGIGNSHA